ncbi:MAG: hypothetical protein H7333_11815 [Bdellovibrionales bacterium]|nr:hypothetical protein [Oligoflexia bacterium]
MRIIAFILLPTLILTHAWAAELELSTIQILRKSGKSERIAGLQFSIPQASDLETDLSKNPPVTRLNLTGTFKNRGTTSILAPDKIVINPAKDGSFSFRVRMFGEATSFDLTEVDSLGGVKTENIQIYAPSPIKLSTKEVQIESAPKAGIKADKTIPKASKYVFTPGFSLTRISYQESSSLKDTIRFSESALTLKGSIVYIPTHSQWSYGLSAYFTALPVGESIPNVSVRFLGINARAGFLFPTIRDPWRVNLMVGYYFTTMLVSALDADLAFGYRNISGPQIFPTVMRLLKNDRDISGYLKFSPISASFSLLSLSSNEIAFGLAYGFKLPNAHRASVSFDLSRIILDIPILNEFKASSSSYSIGMNYTL